VKRRTRLIIKLTASAVAIASVVLARLLSDDDVARFGIGQAALFLAFGVSSIVLFALVVTDFDRWVETVPPVPKRVVRRSVARATRRVRLAGAWALAGFGAAMTWLWSRVGAVLGVVIAHSARRLTQFWSWVARAEAAVLAKAAAALTVFWSWIARGGAWALARSGAGITVVWVWAVRGGVRAVIVYRMVVHRLWTSVGHGFAWTVVRTGRGLTVAWAWAVRGGERGLVRYRAAMQWLWATVARATRWAAGRTATGLRVTWTGVARGLAWTFGRGRAGLGRAWLAVAGRGDEPTPKPIRRWYTATVDAAFGIPPDGASVDVFGGRVAPPGREGGGNREGETVGAPGARTSRGTDDDAVL
jgi:hypothetical protein